MATAPDSLGHEALFLVQLLSLIPQSFRSVKRAHSLTQHVAGWGVGKKEKMSIKPPYKFLRMEEEKYREAFVLPGLSGSLVTSWHAISAMSAMGRLLLGDVWRNRLSRKKVDGDATRALLAVGGSGQSRARAVWVRAHPALENEPEDDVL